MPWYGFALISALGIAMVGLLEKKTLQREHSLEYVTIFSIIKLVLFFAFFWPAIQWTVSSHQFWVLILDGSVVAMAFFMVAKAIRRMEISSAVPVLSLDPGLTAILAWLFLGEHLTTTHVLGLSLLVLGTYVLEMHRAGIEGGPLDKIQTVLGPFKNLWRQKGGGYILAGLAFFSISSTLDRYILKQVPTNTYLGYILVVNAVIFLIWLFLSQRHRRILRPGKGYVLLIIALGAAFHLTSNIAQAKAVSIAAVGLVIAVKRLSVLIDVILGGRFFHEKHLPQKILATMIMLLGLFFVVRA